MTRKKSRTRRFLMGAAIASVAMLAVSLGGCGESGSSNNNNNSGTQRGVSGTINSGSLTGLTIRSRTQAGLAVALKDQSLTCSDLQVCCVGGNGEATAASIDSSCAFRLDLPLESFCFCALVRGDDSDGDGCGDDWIAELGCSENGNSGALPVFADDDDSVDDIALGECSIQGNKVVCETDFCSQVDSDDDGTSDESDTDDDGDSILDDEDFTEGDLCSEADDYDSNNDDIPDIFQAIWDALTDSDSDDIADFCDVSECDEDSDDTDGDCIPDDDDWSGEDSDADGVEFDDDCDDDDAAVTYECYEDDFCSQDLDGDGVDFCNDCDDADENNDLNWDDGCTTECETALCDGDFDCQLYAEEQSTEGNEVCEGGSVSCMTCADGCCVTAE